MLDSYSHQINNIVTSKLTVFVVP